MYSISFSKRSWVKGQSQYFRVKIPNVNERIIEKSGHRLADSMAYHQWGEIGRRSTVLKERDILLKNYACSGHGGYVLINTNPERKGEYKGVLWASSGNYTGLPEGMFFEVYLYEEDQMWAQLSRDLPMEDWEKVIQDMHRDGVTATAARINELANKTYQTIKQ